MKWRAPTADEIVLRLLQIVAAVLMSVFVISLIVISPVKFFLYLGITILVSTLAFVFAGIRRS